MKLVLWALLIAVVLSLGCGRGAGMTLAGVKRDIAKQYPDVPTVSVQEAHDMMSSGRQIVLLDARGVDEFAVSHLKGASRVLTVSEALLRMPVDDVPVLVYCSVGYRSSALARAMMKAGRTNVFNLEGSIFEWVNAGLPVYRGEERVKGVHPYDEKWGRLLKIEI